MTSKTQTLFDTIRKSPIKGVSRREADQTVSKHQVDSLIARGMLSQERILAKKPAHKKSWPDSYITLVRLGPVPYDKQGAEADLGLHRKVKQMPRRTVEYFSQI